MSGSSTPCIDMYSVVISSKMITHFRTVLHSINQFMLLHASCPAFHMLLKLCHVLLDCLLHHVLFVATIVNMLQKCFSVMSCRHAATGGGKGMYVAAAADISFSLQSKSSSTHLHMQDHKVVWHLAVCKPCQPSAGALHALFATQCASCHHLRYACCLHPLPLYHDTTPCTALNLLVESFSYSSLKPGAAPAGLNPAP
jgi:hypothetical protein